ncbi:MAG: acyl--CoA ligase, partial [Calditrichaeota bacterium]|nr:acyl--CoA ligase [Calditrichota bacterium]
MNRFDWMSRWADYSPEKVAIKEIDGDRRITYRQLNNAANRLAVRLTGEMGLKKGDRVAILAENGLPHFVLFSAAQ